MASYSVNMHQVKSDFQIAILDWFKSNHRDYPWRIETKAYRILISEILLQQTNADKVIPVYNQLVHQFPDITALAVADVDRLASLVRPLGLRYRVSRLKEMAAEVLRKFGGHVPSSERDLLTLPGVGKYVANAVLCFAYSFKVPLVDVNVLRLYERVFSLQSAKQRPREDPVVWRFATELLPNDFKEYNWAVIDFCAKMCTVRVPACNVCPVSWACSWLQSRKSHGSREE